MLFRSFKTTGMTVPPLQPSKQAGSGLTHLYLPVTMRVLRLAGLGKKKTQPNWLGFLSFSTPVVVSGSSSNHRFVALGPRYQDDLVMPGNSPR